MKLLFENNDIRCFYKESGEHTISNPNSTEDELMCLYRLDYCTSGLVISAKNTAVFEKIKQLQSKDRIVKTYKACVLNGDLLNKLSLPYKIESYFRPYGKGRMSVRPVQEEELEKYKNKDITKRKYTSSVINVCNDVVTVEITRGFRHQIRAHLSYLGCPMRGDTLYGYNNLNNVRPTGIKLTCTSISIPDVLEYSL